MRKQLFGIALVSTLLAGPAHAHHADVDRLCMKAAIETRDRVVGAAWDSHDFMMHNARIQRKNSLKSAWDEMDKKIRKKLISDAEKHYKSTEKTAKSNLKAVVKAAEKHYKDTVKNQCE